MTIFVTHHPGGVWVQARMEGEGGLVGDVVQVVRPGETFQGKTYQELEAALKEGKLEVEA